MTIPRRNQQGFTLVELLIVVIILGILAAVVIPQFNTASSEAKESALVSNLATVRQAIELYKVQHDDNFPTDAANIGEQLTESTDEAGTTAGSKYGPYLRNGFPNNPINSDNTIIALAAAATDASGWMYNGADGEFRANSTGAGPSEANYFDL